LDGAHFGVGMDAKFGAPAFHGFGESEQKIRKDFTFRCRSVKLRPPSKARAGMGLWRSQYFSHFTCTLKEKSCL
jgi:hypothetical protein